MFGRMEAHADAGSLGWVRQWPLHAHRCLDLYSQQSIRKFFLEADAPALAALGSATTGETT